MILKVRLGHFVYLGDGNMCDDGHDDSREFTPEEVFLYGFDHAIRATVRSLTDIGLDEESIWIAFSKVIALFHTSAVAVECETFNDHCRLGVGIRAAGLDGWIV
ncbi:MAG TPA: hypothetical protein VL992_05300 [Tepidisphaeraceae bacterium]|nr:hypothetical protein [Tepidisphaeraceae bacterium]